MTALKPLAALALAAHLAACTVVDPTAPKVPAPSAPPPTAAGIVGNGGSNLNVPDGGPNLRVPDGGPNLQVPGGGPNLQVPGGGPNVVGPNGAAVIREGSRAPGAPAAQPGAAASAAPAAPAACEDAFVAADKDGNAALTPTELADAGYDTPWADHDADESGKLDEAEFCAMTAPEPTP